MSVPTMGNIDCARLIDVKEKIVEIWNDTGAREAEYIADVEPAMAILDNQTADFKVLTQPDKDREVDIWWVEDCDDEDPDDCDDQCQIEGEEAGTLCAHYALTECFQKSFVITEEKFRTSNLSYEEYVAKIMMKKMKLMDEFWASKALAAMALAAGVNKYAGQYTVVGNKTYIPPVAWNSDVFGYLDTALWMNKLGMSKMLTGTLLKQHYWKTGMESTNPSGAAEVAKMTAFGVPYFGRKVDAILGYKAAFLFNPNALALVTKARHSIYGPEGRKVAQDGGGEIILSTVQSRNLPALTYDLYVDEKCASDDIRHGYKIKSRGDIFQNPSGCDNDLTGVLQMVCGFAP